MPRTTLVYVLTLMLTPAWVLTASGASLYVLTDSPTYNVGDTITVTVVGNAFNADCLTGIGFDLDLWISGNLGFDPALVSVTGISNTTDPLTGCEAWGQMWIANQLNATCGGTLGNNCRAFDYFNGFSGSGQPIAQGSIVFSTITFSADAPGAAFFDWTALDFYNRQNPGPGNNVLIIDGTTSPTPTPSLTSKCDAKKKKEVGKHVLCRMKVFAKASKKGEDPDTTKLDKCDMKFGDKCGKAEEKGDCSQTGDCSALLITTTAAADALDLEVESP